MKRVKEILYAGLVLLSVTVFISCEKNRIPPVISMAEAEGFQSTDTMLSVGDTIKVLIDFTWNGVHKVMDMEMRVNEKVAGTYKIDKEQGQFSVTIVKGLEETEVWDFIITDSGGNTASTTLTLTKDPNSRYGGVKYFDSVSLGAQLNTTRPGFMSVALATYYNLDAAFLNQGKVDLFFFYGSADKAALASPAAEIENDVFTGPQSPAAWTIRNLSLFQKVDLTGDDFLAIYHDGYIIDNFDPSKAFNKAADLAAGNVYLFQISNGKKGILYVISLTPLNDGEVNFAFKIQE